MDSKRVTEQILETVRELREARAWTVCSVYSTDHDAMKWFVSRDSEITPEVEKPERVQVIEANKMDQLCDALEICVEALRRIGCRQLIEIGVTCRPHQIEKCISCGAIDKSASILAKGKE